GVPGRDGIADLSGNRDRAQPRQRDGKIAEAFAEIERWRVDVERLGTDALGTRSAPLDAKPDRHHELMDRILEQAVFERGLHVLKSLCADPGWTTRRRERAVGRPDRDGEGLSDPLGKLNREITPPE